MPLTITYTFSPGAIIYASRFNTNFSDVKNWADAHEVATTGIHGVTGNIVGDTDTQTLSNKTFTGGIVLSGVNFTGDLDLYSGSNINVYSDSGSTLEFQINGTTGSVILAANALLVLDGSILKDYIQRSGAGQIDVYSNAILTTRTTSAGDFQIMNNLGMAPGKAIYLNGLSGTDYILNTSAGVNTLVSNGILTTSSTIAGDFVISNNLGISIGKAIYLRGLSGTDFIANTANGQNDIYAAGTLALRTGIGGTVSFPNGAVSITNTLTVGATSAILPSANATQNIGASATTFKELFLARVASPTANGINANSGVKAWGNVSLTGTLNSGYNCTVVSAGTGTGIYNITFTLPFSSTGYCITASIINASQIAFYTQISSASVAQVIITTTGGIAVDKGFTFMAIGTQ